MFTSKKKDQLADGQSAFKHLRARNILYIPSYFLTEIWMELEIELSWKLYRSMLSTVPIPSIRWSGSYWLWDITKRPARSLAFRTFLGKNVIDINRLFVRRFTTVIIGNRKHRCLYCDIIISFIKDCSILLSEEHILCGPSVQFSVVLILTRLRFTPFWWWLKGR